MGKKIERHLSEYVCEAQDPLELKPENFLRKRSEEKFTCVNQSCGKSFKTRGARNFHVQYHCAKPMRYKCERCDYRTHWKNDVKKHARSKHPELETSVIELFKVRSANKVHSYSCPNEHCNRTYTAKSSLYKHLKYVCGKEPTFRCVFCDYKTFRRYVFIEHVNKHHTKSN
ncbi:zinc finger Y-chromosomal protein 1-like [Cotesia typhae]|uniref:zinc finger Y-chromosomal protein 1-like n=1 Tax=Cotesia typhae TaxID=2053667 RepID=UPI003D69BC63